MADRGSLGGRRLILPSWISLCMSRKNASDLPAGLTAREAEVLRLVAQGWTSRQVATHLSLSPRTINQHLRSIYNKLGVSSRAAANHFAVERGIA